MTVSTALFQENKTKSLKPVKMEVVKSEPFELVGICQTIEKSYFRLTSAPDPNDVRPEPVLAKALKLVLSKWQNKLSSYRYIDDQFRAIRQDLTLQRIQSSLTVQVYE